MTHAEWSERDELALRRMLLDEDEDAWDRQLTAGVRTGRRGTAGHWGSAAERLGSFRSGAGPAVGGLRFFIAVAGGAALALSAVWLAVSSTLPAAGERPAEIASQLPASDPTSDPIPEAPRPAAASPATNLSASIPVRATPDAAAVTVAETPAPAPVLVTPGGSQQAVLLSPRAAGGLEVRALGLRQVPGSVHVLWQVGEDGRVGYLASLKKQPVMLNDRALRPGMRFFVTIEKAGAPLEAPGGPVTMSGTVPRG